MANKRFILVSPCRGMANGWRGRVSRRIALWPDCFSELWRDVRSCECNQLLAGVSDNRLCLLLNGKPRLLDLV